MALCRGVGRGKTLRRERRIGATQWRGMMLRGKKVEEKINTMDRGFGEKKLHYEEGRGMREATQRRGRGVKL